MATVNAGARLDRLPASRFHYRILGLIGGGMFLDGFEIYLQGGVLAAVIGLGWSTPAMNANFISATFAGMVIGAWLAGIAGDWLRPPLLLPVQPSGVRSCLVRRRRRAVDGLADRCALFHGHRARRRNCRRLCHALRIHAAREPRPLGRGPCRHAPTPRCLFRRWSDGRSFRTMAGAGCSSWSASVR